MRAISIYIVWVILTYLFEGRIKTLLRPEATLNRLTYVVVVNFLIGTVIALWIIRPLLVSGFSNLKQMGFRSISHIFFTVLIGGILGFLFYVIQKPPFMNPIVITNAFAQVLTVSIAEVVVCWAIVGSSFESLFKEKGTLVSLVVAIISASILFGIYHFSHSPPFSSIKMVIFLTFIGVGTG